MNEKHEIRRGSLWMIAFGAALWGLDALFILALQHWLTSIEIVCFEHALPPSLPFPYSFAGGANG